MYIRSSIAVFLFSLIAAPLFLLPLPRKFYFKFIYPVFDFLFLFSSKIKINNLSNKSLKFDEPVIFASNHKSFVDFCIISHFIKRPFTIIINNKIYNNIFFKPIADKILLIPVDNDDVYSQTIALERVIDMAKNKKYSIIIFPEGQYNSNKILGPLKNGIAKIAKETGIKVIPIAIYGINESFINGKKHSWQSAYLKAGYPISYEEYNDKKNFMTKLEKEITNLYTEIEKELKSKRSYQGV